ncbi:MAG: hypothetical protein QXH02_00800 [Desulfurococcaceae archaeon]
MNFLTGFPLNVTKVIVEVQLDFSDESDKALRALFSIAEELLDNYGLWVEIIPIHLWFTDPLEAEVSDLPRIFINGKLRFIGRAPRRGELIDAILEHAGLPPKPGESTYSTIPTKINFDGGLPEVALVNDDGGIK